MNGRDRVLTVLRGGMPDRVPFAPNIGQWFSHRKYTGTLPAELEGCEDELDAMMRLKCDIFSRRLGPFFRTEYPGLEVRRYYEPAGNGGAPGGQRVEIEPPRSPSYGAQDTHPPESTVVTEVVTPHGTLRTRARFVPDSHTTFQLEHFVKDFENDYRALRYVIESSVTAFDDEAYLKTAARLGEQGHAFVTMAQSPIKLLHIWAGLENATLFMADYERQCRELFEIHTRKVLDMAQQAVRSSALCFSLGDNLDSMFYSPPLFRKFDLRFRQQVAEVLHGGGKLMFSHACGRLWGLRELIAEAGLDGLEAISHPPLGDLPLPEARKIHPRFVVNGGMTAHDTEVFDDPRATIRDNVRSLFRAMGPLDRFIFASACNTSIRTPWENLIAFRDACWEFGETGG